jgi:hypothetical protein
VVWNIVHVFVIDKTVDFGSIAMSLEIFLIVALTIPFIEKALIICFLLSLKGFHAAT